MHSITFDPQGEFCLTDQTRRLVLEDIENIRAALERCNGTINLFNRSVEK